MRAQSVILDPESVDRPPGEMKSTNGAGEKIRELTEKRRRFADARGDGMSIEAAQRYAGYKVRKVIGKQLERVPEVARAIALKHEEVADQLKMTRQEVLAGFLDAIELGRTQADAHAMIKGWEQIGKMCGFYAPEVKKLDVSVSAKRMIDKFEQMSDDELLKIAEKTFEGVGERVAEPAQEELPDRKAA